jgi:hypothetical protein
MNEWTMKLQMSDDDARESIIEIARRWNKREIRETTVISVTHMHATIEHDSFSIDVYYNAAFPNLLTSTYVFIKIKNCKRDSKTKRLMRYLKCT